LKTFCAVLTITGLLITAHRLPAPIREIESATPAPKPKHSHQISSQRNHGSESAIVASNASEIKRPSGPATVFIYRPAGFPWGMYNTSTIIIDGAQTRTMADPRYSVRKLNPGRHAFEVKGGVITNQHVPIEIDLQSGQTYYLRVSIDAMGFPEGKIIFVQVPNAQGTEEIAKLKQGP
jgi:Protein of unknown function (DUF2846)